MKKDDDSRPKGEDTFSASIKKLACTYRTLVELLTYYNWMDYFDRVDRLDSMQEWLEEALESLVGKQQVKEWEEEAKSQKYSSFAL